MDQFSDKKINPYKLSFSKVGVGLSEKQLIKIQQLILKANQLYPLPEIEQQQDNDAPLQNQADSKHQNKIKTKIQYLSESIGYPKQCKFIKFHLEQLYGRNFQVLVYSKLQQNGHCLYCSEQMFAIVQWKAAVYCLWKTNLIE